MKATPFKCYTPDRSAVVSIIFTFDEGRGQLITFLPDHVLKLDIVQFVAACLLLLPDEEAEHVVLIDCSHHLHDMGFTPFEQSTETPDWFLKRNGVFPTKDFRFMRRRKKKTWFTTLRQDFSYYLPEEEK